MKTLKTFGTITRIEWDDIIPKTNSERAAKYYRTDKGRAARSRRKIKNGPADYLDRPFIAWDGEGVSLPDRSHRYTLFASSLGTTLQDDTGLNTRAIFDCLINSKLRNPNGINVIYGGSYDFNMWMNDLPRDTINRLYEKGRSYWGRYRLEWRRGKCFTITDRELDTTVTIYDVVSFFQCPFVQACDDYLGDRFINRDMIVANKAARGTFTTADNSQVAEYNQAELDNLVNLMTELRLRLHKVTLRPKRWDGPGAIASALLSREKIKTAMSVCPDEVAEAARYAYFGGRFEVIKTGNVTGNAYEYDVNSAYPNALRNVPNLARGTWQQINSPLPPTVRETFALYHCRWTGSDEQLHLPHPFPTRIPDGRVFYPYLSQGWYWGPEVYVAAQYAREYGGVLEILDAWEFIPDNPDDKPFHFINEMYTQRQALKAAKDGAHVGLKLGLNSLYGKSCQKVGYRPAENGHPAKLPPFHQLEWAGYVTSHCRSLILGAVVESHALDTVIAFETDAMFTTEPLPVICGTGLGEWEYTLFTHLAYIQSGFYFGTVDGNPFAKTRGIDRGSMTFADVLERLSEPLAADRVATAQLSRFIGVGLARQLNDWTRWQHWETNPKNITLEPTGKRVHLECYYCDGTPGITPNVWHDTIPPFGHRIVSSEYPIPWINPNPDMTDLDDFNTQRREDMAADYE